jgi:ABC-type branched-subunit amino acid transport system permease subunit
MDLSGSGIEKRDSMRLSSATILALVAAVFFALLPLRAANWMVADFSVYFTYAIFAISLAFLWGHAGLLSLGHGVYFGLGAYAMSVVTLGMIPGLPGLRSTWLGLTTAVAVAGISAAGFGWFFFASRGLRGAFLGIVTLALAVVIERLAINTGWLGGMNGLMNVPPINLGLNGSGAELYDPIAIYYVMLAILAGVLAAMTWITASSFGLALAARRENELRIWTLGYDVARLKIGAFAIAGALAGLSGALFVTQFGFASPSLIGFALSADVLIWVALGGRGALIAAALGAIAVRFIESKLSGSLGTAWPLALGALFMLSVILFPRGIFGALIHYIDQIRRAVTENKKRKG